MKTDKKKLMRKLIAVGLMASMLTANTMTYGSSLILPGINAEAFSAEAETKLASITETYDISALAQNFVATAENGGVMRIDITENGTYLFKGTNYKEADGGCYIDVQVTVPAGVEANFIFDDCTIVNNIDNMSFDSGDKVLESPYYIPFVINGTVNVYIKSASELFMNDKSASNAEERDSFARSFSGDGTVNIMESEDRDAVLTLSSIETGELNINGGILDAYSLFSKKIAINDGTAYVYRNGYIDTITTKDYGYAPINSLKYTGGNAYLSGKLNDGTAPANSWFYNIGENKQITDLNGTKLNQTYSVNSDGGSLIAYIDYSQFSASNAPYLVADNELLVYTDAGSQFLYNSVNLGDPAALKITKEYDRTTGIGEQTIEPITMNGYTLTPDLSAVTLTGSDVGEYTAKVPFKFTKDGTEYTFKYEVDVEITAKPLTVSSVTVEDKVYDGTTTATVKEVVFEGLVDTDTLVLGTDYTVTAAFADKDAGTDKTVNVTVTLADTVKNYALEANTVTAKASIIADDVSGTANNGAGTFTYESVDPVSPLVKAEGEPDGSDFMIIEKDQNQTTTTYYFVYKVKLSDLAGKSTGTVYIALSEDGEQTRKFATNDIFENVTIEGKIYTPPEEYYYMVYAVSDVPNTEQLFCSAKVQLS